MSTATVEQNVDAEPAKLSGEEKAAWEAATHPDDHLTFDQLVRHGRHLFGYPTWAVEAAMRVQGLDPNSTHSVDDAREAVMAFMRRVEK